MESDSRRDIISGQKMKLRVWDPIVRIFHWTVVIGIFLNYAVFEEGKLLHRYTGYIVVVAVIIRVIWGIVGNGYARFSGFVVSPREFMSYIKDMLRLRNHRYVGHNPAGGWMIIALLCVISVLCVSGWMQTLDAFWGTEWLREVHETAANLVVFMAATHILAVVIEGKKHRENLILAMFTGRKRPATGTDVDRAHITHRR